MSPNGNEIKKGKRETNPLREIRKWLGKFLVVGIWAYNLYRIFTETDSQLQLFDSDFASATVFTIFWWSIVGLMYFLYHTEFTTDNNGNITGDSEITW